MDVAAAGAFRSRKRWLVPGLALILTGLPLVAATAASGMGHADRPAVVAAAAEDPMVAETRQVIDVFVQRWNENKLEELVEAHYVEDAIVMPPNHEPIRGRAAILEFFKGVRNVLGEFDEGDYLMSAKTSGNLVSWAGQYNFRGGKIRFVTHELYERQPDGSLRNTVDMFGYRDPGK